VPDTPGREPSHEALHLSAELYQALLRVHDDVGDGVVVAGADRVHLTNDSFCRISGYSAQELRQMPSLLEIVVPEEREIIHDSVRRHLGGERAERHYQTAIIHRDGHRVDIEVGLTHAGLGDDVRLIAIVRDITERKLFETQLTRQAFHDALTGLPNRALFMYSIEHALASASRNKRGVAILFVDVDRFKTVNDDLGHGIGDEALVALGQRIKACLRPGDTVARVGGDEFTILLEDLSVPDEAEGVARRVIGQLREPFALGGRSLSVTASIGIAFGMPDEVQPTDLLRFADMAMYRAKAEGRARYVVFDQTMRDRSIARMSLETDLRQALGRDELRVHYQPIVALITGRVLGAEALLRWQHPDRGLISPSEFIQLAEETGVILPVGRWILTESCHQATRWQVEHPSDPPYTISVNLSPRQFRQDDLVEQVTQVLAATGLDPGCLKLDITESMVMDDAPKTLGKLEALSALGVTLELDDFGTGYCSLNELRRLPTRAVKLDRSFVHGITTDGQSLAIVHALTSLAHAIGMDVTAKGVETEAQLAQLLAIGCDRGQGYYFAQPLTPEAMGNLLMRQHSGGSIQ
jgi:diguanylate cyclase (GGDEF)-like protein/PAS domain S-box-containing protein